MSTQLRGRRSGAFWSLLFLMTMAALAIGYVLGAQRSGSPLIQSAAQVISATETPCSAANGVGSNPNLTPATNAPITGCVGVVQARSASLTTGPSTTYATVGIVYKNQSLRLVGHTASNTWFKVQDGAEGWIRADLITVQAGCTLSEIDLP